MMITSRATFGDFRPPPSCRQWQAPAPYTRHLGLITVPMVQWRGCSARGTPIMRISAKGPRPDRTIIAGRENAQKFFSACSNATRMFDALLNRRFRAGNFRIPSSTRPPKRDAFPHGELSSGVLPVSHGSARGTPNVSRLRPRNCLAETAAPTDPLGAQSAERRQRSLTTPTRDRPCPIGRLGRTCGATRCVVASRADCHRRAEAAAATQRDSFAHLRSRLGPMGVRRSNRRRVSAGSAHFEAAHAGYALFGCSRVFDGGTERGYLRGIKGYSRGNLGAWMAGQHIVRPPMPGMPFIFCIISITSRSFFSSTWCATWQIRK
jgi:hypothetical protein